MNLQEAIKNAKAEIIIAGTTPIADLLLDSVPLFQRSLTKNPDLTLSILYESDDELYHQSLFLNHVTSESPRPYADLTEARDLLQGMKTKILHNLTPAKAKKIEDRISIQQINLRLPLNIIKIDSALWIAVVLADVGGVDGYTEVSEGHPWRDRILSQLTFYIDPAKGGDYRFDPSKDKQLIQMYDFGTPPKPRGDAPRKAFYNNRAIQRRSVWGFVFDRSGRLLLHKRSDSTADNRGMWDKSFGGHVDTGEDSLITAKRELVEEFFLPSAEYTLHLQEDISLILTLGDWAPPRGPAGSVFIDQLAKAYSFLPDEAWGLFVPNISPQQNRVIHTSKRHYTHSDGKTTEWKDARFIADIFFAVTAKDFAPENLIKGTKKSAAADHDLIDVSELVRDLDRNPFDTCKYTEDLHYMFDNYEDVIIRFSKFIQRIFRSR